MPGRARHGNCIHFKVQLISQNFVLWPYLAARVFGKVLSDHVFPETLLLWKKKRTDYREKLDVLPQRRKTEDSLIKCR